MKTLVLAVAVGAACVNFANAGDLKFDPDTELGKSIQCGVESDTENCESVTFEYGLSAFLAFESEVSAKADLEFAEGELAAAQAVLASLNPLAAGYDSAVDDVTTAETALSSAQENLADASATLAGFSGQHANNAIAYAEAELAIATASDNFNVADAEALIASADAAVAQTAIDDAAVLKNAALADYQAATEALNADPENEVLQQNKIATAQSFSDAGEVLSDAEESGAQVIAASETANLALAEANTALEDALTASDLAWDLVTDDHKDWEASVETAVIAAQHAVDDATEVLTAAEESLTSAEAVVADAQAAVDSATTGTESAAQAVADAEAAVTSAQAAFDGLSGDASEDEINTALTTLTDSQDAEAEAVLLAAQADIALADSNAALDLAQQDALLSTANVEIAQLGVNDLTQTLDASLSELEVHAAYIGDDSNPAKVLLDTLISESDHGQAVVTAVSDTYGYTVINANGIASNATAIGENTVAIGANTVAIGANTVAIGENTAAIGVNSADIATNRADISTNTASISQMSNDIDILRSGVAASLAAAGMPLAPGEGWGAAIGTGYFDGESAIAAGVTYRAEKYNFKFAVGSSGSETTASAGVAWDF